MVNPVLVRATMRENDGGVVDLSLVNPNDTRVVRDHLDGLRPEKLNFVVPTAGDMTIRLAVGVELHEVFAGVAEIEHAESA